MIAFYIVRGQPLSELLSMDYGTKIFLRHAQNRYYDELSAVYGGGEL